ncbi:hypothetical protein XaC1_551 [Xanthomonas phage XaC1]|nr:hypothetical protein XaC1_551 [Xanthomonas phage XaC1]
MNLPDELVLLRTRILENQGKVDSLDSEIKELFTKKILVIDKNNNVITKEVQEISNKIEYNFKIKSDYENRVKRDKELVLSTVLA